MARRIRILHLEDQPADCELVTELLRSDGLEFEIVRVESRDAFVSALRDGRWDVVLSDFRIPGYDGGAALEHVRGQHPLLPFIVVSGTVGEDHAVEILKRGATDYVLKQRLRRLPQAVRRALHELREREELARAEEQVREQAALLDEARDAIVVQDLEGRVRYWNRGAERLFGWTAAEAAGGRTTSLFFSGFTRGLAEAQAAVLERGAWAGELEKRDRAGQRVRVESRWTLLRTALGAPRAVLTIDSDVTQQRAIEAQLLRAQRMESLGMLAGGIAHDLNNVLAPILMAVDVLRRSPGEERQQRMLNAVEGAAQRGAELVKQVVTFARGMEGERGGLQLRHLLGELQRIVVETFPAAIQVSVQVPPDLWTVWGDATQLHQVLLNLCVNARDAMPRGGRLTVLAENATLSGLAASAAGLATEGRYVLLSVGDTGTGIEPAVRERIFEPFFTTKEPGRGTGLGLSTSLAIVRSHMGALNVVSEPGQGATFRVYLPATQAEAPSAARPSEQFPAGAGQRLLVVDDEASVRELARETLESHGYVVETAPDGAEALARFSRPGPRVELVLMDLQMPGMEGPSALRALRGLDPHVRAILMTGSGEPPAGPALGDERARVAVLRKPYSASELLTLVAHVLSARR